MDVYILHQQYLRLKRKETVIRATEILDFLNRDDISDEFEYSHLEIREEITDKNGKKRFLLKENYKRLRKDYRKGLNVKKTL